MALKRKKTGEADMTKEILEERNPVSFISGIKLGPFINGPMHRNLFAHVISKNGNLRLNFPNKELKDKHLRLNKDNVVLLTPREHQLYDHGTAKARQEYVNEQKKQGFSVNWDKLFDKKERLITHIQNELR